MYIVKEKDLRGVDKVEVQARMEVVGYLTEWSGDVFKEAKEKRTISLAGRYIRSRVLEKGDTLARMLDAVVLVDLMDFWSSVDGYKGKRDDVLLYGIFCMLFSEVNADMLEESKKVEGNIGFAPRLRYDVSERTATETARKAEEAKKKKRFKGKGVKNKTKGTNKKGKKSNKTKGKHKGDSTKVNVGLGTEEEGLVEDGLDSLGEEEAIVEIKDKYVTPDNVNKLTILAVGLIGVLVVSITCLILF